MAGAFTIARGAKHHVDVVVVEIAEESCIGRGEATPIYYHGEDAATVIDQIEAARPAIEGGADRAALQSGR